MVRISIPKPEWTYKEFRQEVARCAAEGTEVIRLTAGSTRLNALGLERLLADERLAVLCAASRFPSDIHLVIDLRECTFLDPYGLTAVRALCAVVASRVQRIWLCLPTSPDVQMYFGVAGLNDGLRTAVTLVGEVAGRIHPSNGCDVLLPLTTICGELDVEAAAGTARERLDSMLTQLGWPTLVAERTRQAILETAMNVLDHAESHGYLAVQGYRLDSPNGFVIVAISDAGVGIRHTLARVHARLADPQVSDGEVLHRMFREHLTSRTIESGGHGMRVLQDAIQVVGGSLTVRSGRGSYQQRQRSVYHRTGFYIPGTHVRLSLDRPRH